MRGRTGGIPTPAQPLRHCSAVVDTNVSLVPGIQGNGVGYGPTSIAWALSGLPGEEANGAHLQGQTTGGVDRRAVRALP